jgi:hypothetical protein
MAGMGDHETAEKRRDHLWVAVIIAACALLEVWVSWVTIGSLSGFPELLGKIPTDWTLTVTVEAYWGYALYSWLAAAPGPRSRGFAKWSAGVMFAFSLTGQAAAHLVKPGTPVPAYVVVFVSSLPVIVLALIAVLIHLRQEDGKEAMAAARKVRKADEVTALRAELDAARAAHGADVRAAQKELATEQGARAKAEQEAARGTAVKAERDRLRTELDAAQEAAEAAGSARAEAAREAASAGAEAALRLARCGELETVLASAQTELRLVREARETEGRNLRTGFDAERRARVDLERNAALLPVVQQQLDEARAAAQTAQAAQTAAETGRAEAEERAARAEAKAASLTRKPGTPAGSRGTRSAAPAEAPAGRTQLEVARAAREKADRILAEAPDTSGAALADLCGMSERWGQEHKKQFLKRSLSETA